MRGNGGIGNEYPSMDMAMMPLVPSGPQVSDTDRRAEYDKRFVEFQKVFDGDPSSMGERMADDVVLTYVRPVEASKPVPASPDMGNEYARKKLDYMFGNEKGRGGFLKRFGDFSIDNGSYNFPSGRIEYHADGQDRKIILLTPEGQTSETIVIGSM